MTVVCFLMRGDDIAGFEISGHSGAGVSGSDIVCAAISSAAYMTVNTITDVIHAQADVSVSDGKMKLLVAEEFTEQTQALLAGFMLHMKQLRKQRPNNIKIVKVNTGKEHYYA